MPTHLKDLDKSFRTRRGKFREYVIKELRHCECKPYCYEHKNLHMHEWFADGNSLQGKPDWVYDIFFCHPANVILLGEDVHLSTKDKPGKDACRIIVYRRNPSFFWPYGFSNGQEALEHLFKCADDFYNSGVFKTKIPKP